jgi:hypothetical protein
LDHRKRLGTIEQFCDFVSTLERFCVCLELPHNLGPKKARSVFLLCFAKFTQTKSGLSFVVATAILGEEISKMDQMAVSVPKLVYSRREDNHLLGYVLLRICLPAVTALAKKDLFGTMPVVRTSFSLEHIFPQNPREEDNVASADDLKAHRHELGNLILVTSTLNSILGNKPFREKVVHYTTVDAQTVLPKLTPPIKENDWTFADFEARHKDICDKFVAFLKGGVVTHVTTTAHAAVVGLTAASTQQPNSSLASNEKRWVARLLNLKTSTQVHHFLESKKLSQAEFELFVDGVIKALQHVKADDGALVDAAKVGGSTKDAFRWVAQALHAAVAGLAKLPLRNSIKSIHVHYVWTSLHHDAVSVNNTVAAPISAVNSATVTAVAAAVHRPVDDLVAIVSPLNHTAPVPMHTTVIASHPTAKTKVAPAEPIAKRVREEDAWDVIDSFLADAGADKSVAKKAKDDSSPSIPSQSTPPQTGATQKRKAAADVSPSMRCTDSKSIRKPLSGLPEE